MTLRVVPLESSPAISRDEGVLHSARASLENQSGALLTMAQRLDAAFCRAVELILACKGRIVVSGIGKSGLVGRKIAATLACSGTPSFFLHPGEAAHGDLGMVTEDDLLLLLSNSGETSELVFLLPYLLELNVPIIAMVGRPGSSLGRAASVTLDTGVDRESCPHNLVPTTSALATLAMGDALSMSVMTARSFQAMDFGRLHPGGSLGRRLGQRVADTMQQQQLPLVPPDARVGDALLAMTEGRCGLAIVIDDQNRPQGIITDGDLRRALQKKPDVLGMAASEIMTLNPVTVHEQSTVNEAEERMHRLRLKALVVVDDAQRVSGVFEIFHGQ